MERVTEYTRFHGGMLAVLKNSNRYSAIERLAAIEDILGADYDLDRLKELIEADRDGRCVVLLSNDDVYTIRGDIVNGIIKANCRDECKPPKSALKGDQHGKT